MAKVMLTAFEKRIQDAVRDNAKLKAFITYIEKYMDRNSEVIFDQGPSKPLLFSNNDAEQISIFTGITEKEVKEVMKNVTSVQASWKLLNNYFIILSVFTIRELEKQNKVRERDLLIMYLSLRIYSGKQKTYFKYGVNDNIMAYTLNNLTDKFKYKTLKNNYAVIKDTVLTVHEHYKPLLLKGEDDMLNIYYPQMYNRINKVLRNIAKEYYDNYKDKKYLNTIAATDEEGNIGEYEDSDGLISSIAENTANYFFASAPNMNIARNVSDKNNIPYVQLVQSLIAIRKEEPPEVVLNLFKSILAAIYDVDKSLIANICTTKFAVNAIKQLSISNTSSKPLIDVKNTLDRLLEEHCSKYAMTQRAATKMAYRNAIYTYFIYIMIGNRCG